MRLVAVSATRPQLPAAGSTPSSGEPIERPQIVTTTPQAQARANGERVVRIALLLLAAGVAWACLPFVPGLLGAVVLCVVATPAYRALAPRVGERTSALLVVIAAAILIALPVGFLAAAMIQEAPAALQRMLASDTFARIALLRVGDVEIGALLRDAGRSLVAWGSGRALSAAAGVTQVILNLFLALLGLYYLLPTAPALWRKMSRLIPFSPSGVSELAERFKSTTQAGLLGIAATSVAQGLTVGLAFTAVGLSNPLFWGVVTGAVSILPVFGSALVWGPGVAVLFAERRYGAAATLAAIGVVVCSNVDNVIRPIIYRRVSGLHPMTSLVGAFAGVQLFGLIGVLLGPLALTYCVELYHLYDAEYLHAPPTAADASAGQQVLSP